MTPPKAWRSLEESWQLAFELAWEAYRMGTSPVGAVLTDGDGTVVVSGRNRVYDGVAPDRRFARSPLAHADVDALVTLAPERRYEDHTLWTTLEPCLLCVGAVVTAAVGAVRYAAADPYAGAARTSSDTAHARRLPLRVDGPLPGAMGLVGSVLHLEPYLRNNPGGAVVRTYRDLAPPVVAAAEALLSKETLGAAARRRTSFATVVGEILAVLPRS